MLITTTDMLSAVLNQPIFSWSTQVRRGLLQFSYAFKVTQVILYIKKIHVEKKLLEIQYCTTI